MDQQPKQGQGKGQGQAQKRKKDGGDEDAASVTAAGGNGSTNGSHDEDFPPEILNQATTAQSFSGNATPLMMGALAYIILFIPVVALGRFLETRFAWRRS